MDMLILQQAARPDTGMAASGQLLRTRFPKRPGARGVQLPGLESRILGAWGLLLMLILFIAISIIIVAIISTKYY